VKAPSLEALKQIALHGGLGSAAVLSSRDLGKLLGVSQQAASLRILELLEAGLITRDVGGRQQRLQVTAKGGEALRREYAEYRRLFEVAEPLTVEGTVTTGLGEGAFYMRQEGYRSQFRQKLGFEPFSGTLNLRVEGRDRTTLELLRSLEGVPIEEFKSGGRTYGGAKCFPATLRGTSCAVILPLRTHHEDILEVISATNLREALGLKDGNVVELHIGKPAG